VAYQAEYIWLDGYQPTAGLRSKTKILADDVTEPPVWGFDGSSTEQATGDKSDCMLHPVFTCPDPIRGGNNILVMCEVMLVDGSPHPTNTRNAAAKIAKKWAKHDFWFGLEQEYTLLKPDMSPLGFPERGYPGPQGPYYCGVGAEYIFGREIIEEHTQACIDAGLKISGTNAEVMPGQWEFQIGPAGVTEAGDHMYVARWLLKRIAEDYDVVVSFAAKPAKGDWNGAGMHTNFSSVAMREDYKAVIAACEAIGSNYLVLVENYGADIQDRLTGKHETAQWNKFSYGVSDRGSSIRIPWQVAVDKKGYAEDRRPNANADPYTVTRLITDTVASIAAGKNPPKK